MDQTAKQVSGLLDWFCKDRNWSNKVKNTVNQKYYWFHFWKNWISIKAFICINDKK